MVASTRGTVKKLDFHLSPSTWLRVRIVDPSGAHVHAELTIIAADGTTAFRGVAGETHVAWTGPFPAGTYRVLARSGERVSERSVTLSGSEERKEIELVFE